MSEFITVARPYARAAFDFAVEHNEIEHWQKMLNFASELSLNETMKVLLSSTLAPETLAQHFKTICGDVLDCYGFNFIKLLAENKRLNVLPYIFRQFILLREAYEEIIEVEVDSVIELDKQQRAKIIAAMEKRFSRKVQLNCNIDQSVIAGFIIHAGDIVIDNSIRGRINRLAEVLQS